MRSQVNIYFDGECPFCKRYVAYLRLKKSIDQVELIDLRSATREHERFERLGINVDQGMVVELDNEIYWGDKALHILALLSSRQDAFNRLNFAIFSNKWASALFYPLLRMFRNFTLFILGRRFINQGNGSSESLFCLFSFVWGLLAVLHFIVYATQFGSSLYFTTWLIPLFGIALIIKPGHKRIFLILLLIMFVDAWLQMPSLSNHTIIKNFFLFGLLLSGLTQWIRGGNWETFFENVAPIGRFLLVVMYVFGVFHKINSGFLNEDVSCAVDLWRSMPFPLREIDYYWMWMLAIYGTLVIETIILALLLYKPTRHMGIFLGIMFHSLLGLSGYAFYPTFSTLTVALHVLFIAPDSANRIVNSSDWQNLQRRLNSPLGYLALAVWLLVIGGLAYLFSFSEAAIIWLVGVVAFTAMLFRNYQRSINAELAGGRAIWSRSTVLNIVSLVFFFNCITPYMGLKTAQSINMFANLRLEGGVSNHLLLSSAPGPFPYLEDVVEITASRGSIYLSRIQASGLHLTYYDLLSRLDKNPNTTVSFIRDGKKYQDQNSTSLQPDIEDILHPEWFRKWFHFSAVDLRSPKPCALDR